MVAVLMGIMVQFREHVLNLVQMGIGVRFLVLVMVICLLIILKLD